ncbi:MAG: complex I NDUFA9 subunit family protein [Tepidisphaerales bacterium]
MRVLLTGGTGFVGRYVLARLLEHGHEIHLLTRTPPPSLPPPPAPAPPVRHFVGDLSSHALRQAADGCDAAIHLVGIIRETAHQTFRSAHVDGTRAVLDACRDAGVRRYVHMSALGTRPDAVSEYHRTKWAAEQLVRDSGLQWTIFRPSMIVGPDGEFVRMVRGWAEGKSAPWLVFPYFRAGLLGLGRHSRVQPVAVTDVARAFVDALTRPDSVGKVYDLVGPETYTWPEFYRLLARTYGLPSKPALPVPIWYALLLARLVPASLLPFNLAQVQMAAEDNVGDAAPFVRDFGWQPRTADV